MATYGGLRATYIVSMSLLAVRLMGTNVNNWISNKKLTSPLILNTDSLTTLHTDTHAHAHIHTRAYSLDIAIVQLLVDMQSQWMADLWAAFESYYEDSLNCGESR